MLDQEKEKVMRNQLDDLYSKIDDGESLNNWNKWLLIFIRGYWKMGKSHL